MASHHLQEVEEICDEVLVLQDGAARARGSLGDLLGTEDLALVVRGLPPDRLGELCATAERLGGAVVASGPQRQHLFALFRRLAGARREAGQ